MLGVRTAGRASDPSPISGAEEGIGLAGVGYSEKGAVDVRIVCVL